MKIRHLVIISVVAGAVLGAGLAWWKVEFESSQAFTFSGRTMGTTYHITVSHFPPDEPRRQALLDKVERTLEEVNRQMSTYRKDAEITRFNESTSTDPFPVSPDFLGVTQLSLEVAESTGGAFEPTIGPLVDLWGFGPSPKTGKAPLEEAIAAARAKVGYRMLHVREGALVKDRPDLHLDLSAIAKGFGVDKAAEVVSREGALGYLVEIGGEVVAKGLNAEGNPWRVGVQAPIMGGPVGQDFEEVIQLTAGAVATSGDYRNFFQAGAETFSHILDPRTGRPAIRHVASVSIRAKTCAFADAAATAVVVLGPDDGLKWIESLPGVEALLLVRNADGTLERRISAGWDGPVD